MTSENEFIDGEFLIPLEHSEFIENFNIDELNKIYSELVSIRETISNYTVLTELTEQITILNTRLDFISYGLLPLLLAIITSYLIIKKCLVSFCK